MYHWQKATELTTETQDDLTRKDCDRQKTTQDGAADHTGWGS